MNTSTWKSSFATFKKELGTSQSFYFTGAFSPLLCGPNWADCSDPEYPRVTILYIGVGRNTQGLVDADAYYNHARIAFKNYLQTPALLSKWILRYKKIAKKIDSFHTQWMSSDLSKQKEIDLCQGIIGSKKLLDELISHTLFIETFSKKMATEHISITDEEWHVISHPCFESFEHRRARQIHQILNLRKPITLSQVRLLKYMFTDYFEGVSDANAARKLHAILKRPLRKELHYKNKISAKLNRIYKFVQTISKLRDLRKDPIAKTMSIAYEIGIELARRAKIPKRVIFYIHPVEYAQGVDYLRKNYSLYIQRLNGYYAFYKKDGNVIIDSEDYKLMEKELLSLIKIGINEVQGECASSGKVTGIARVMSHPSQMTVFNKGDILITGMTRPEFMPLMKNAGAVVTNEGGVTCHAAIVSRELKIPCVIATKHATQVFSDGDLVEVDANKGIVRKI